MVRARKESKLCGENTNKTRIRDLKNITLSVQYYFYSRCMADCGLSRSMPLITSKLAVKKNIFRTLKDLN